MTTSRPQRLLVPAEKDEMANSSSTASSTTTTAVEECDKTANVLQHLLERMESQEQTIQKLEKTVESQNDTLKDIMTSMQAGFASLLDIHKTAQLEASKNAALLLMDADTTHTRNSGKSSSNKKVGDTSTTTAVIASPERDRPVITTAPSDVPPSTSIGPAVMTTNRSNQSTLERSYTVQADEEYDEDEEDDDYETVMEDQGLDDVSLLISQLPSPRTTYLQQRLHGNVPPKRPSRHLSSDSEVSSLGFSSHNSGATFYNSKTSDGTHQSPSTQGSSQAPKRSLLGNGGGGGGADENSHSDNDTVELNTDTTKSSVRSPNDKTHTVVSQASPSNGSCSCRQSIAQNQSSSNHTRGGCSPMDADSGGRDKMPLPPNYIPSPSTNPKRSFRARGTSAPVLGFPRKKFGDGGNGMPRLPTREDSVRNMGDSCSQDSLSKHSQDIRGLDKPATASSSTTRSNGMARNAPTFASASVQEETQLLDPPMAMKEAPVAAAGPEEKDDAQQPPTLSVSLHSKSEATETECSEDATQEKSTCPELLQPSESWNKVKSRTSSLGAGPMTILGMPPRKNSFRSKIPRPYPSSSTAKDPYTRQGMASLNMSCVTLDSALIDEVPEEEWIGSDDEDESEHHAIGKDNKALVVENDY